MVFSVELPTHIDIYDDFAIEELINRHVKVAMKIVDKSEAPPAMQKDVFWDIPNPQLMKVKHFDDDENDAKLLLITSQEKFDPRI